MTEEQRSILSLSLIPKVGPVVSKQLINKFGNAQNIFKTTKGKLAKTPGIGPKLSNAIHGANLQAETDRIIEESNKNQISIHFYNSISYPNRLKTIPDAPIVLYSKGNIDLQPEKTIGIVGTRKASRYGLRTTSEIVASSKASGPTIISGLAFGIDVKAHREALDQGLKTIAVLACGLDKIYPASHQATGHRILENGGTISEYPIGISADPRFFPARNRILAALSDALIVVEAAKKGGALITANMAFGYERPVFAVPGQLHSTYSEGCNQLISRLRAIIYTSFNDVIQELNWDLAQQNRQIELFNKMASLKGLEKKVIQVIMDNKQQVHIEQLMGKIGVTPSELAHILLELEFKGLIQTLPGKEYKIA